MDIRMPVLDGIAATRELTAAGLPSRVLVLTTYDLDRYVYDALAAGAAGFLLKATPPDRLVEGIRTVAAGEALLAPTLTQRLIETYLRQPPPVDGMPDELATLTERERRRARNREDPRQPGARQTGRRHPGPSSGTGLRVRPGQAGRAHLRGDQGRIRQVTRPRSAAASFWATECCSTSSGTGSMRRTRSQPGTMSPSDTPEPGLVRCGAYKCTATTCSAQSLPRRTATSGAPRPTVTRSAVIGGVACARTSPPDIG
jgi:CheY-like chemotaxis protein